MRGNDSARYDDRPTLHNERPGPNGEQPLSERLPPPRVLFCCLLFAMGILVLLKIAGVVSFGHSVGWLVFGGFVLAGVWNRTVVIVLLAIPAGLVAAWVATLAWYVIAIGLAGCLLSSGFILLLIEELQSPVSPSAFPLDDFMRGPDVREPGRLRTNSRETTPNAHPTDKVQ